MTGEDLYDEIISIIREETTYLRHYEGKVVDLNDPLQKGRVKIAIEELGFGKASAAIWCNPRQGSSLLLPKVGSYAEVYFLSGDRTRPVYLYPAGNTRVLEYTGDIKNQVLYEDQSNRKNNIKIDIVGGVLTLFNGTESFVLGDTFLTWLENFVTNIFNVHTHVAPSGGGTTSGPAVTGTAPSNILSEKIKGK